jgi:hypothetical protein
MAANIRNEDAFNEAFNEAFKPSFFSTKKAKTFAEHVALTMQIDEIYINSLYNQWYGNLDVELRKRNKITARNVFIEKFSEFLTTYINKLKKETNEEINEKIILQRIGDIIRVEGNPLTAIPTNANPNNAKKEFNHQYKGLSESNAASRKRVINAVKANEAKAAKAAKGGRRRRTTKKLTKKNRSRKSK